MQTKCEFALSKLSCKMSKLQSDSQNAWGKKIVFFVVFVALILFLIIAVQAHTKIKFIPLAAAVKASTRYVRLAEADRFVPVCAHVQARFIFAGSGVRGGANVPKITKSV